MVVYGLRCFHVGWWLSGCWSHGCWLQGSKVVEDQSMDKAVTTTDAPQQNATCGLVQKADIVPGNGPSTPEQEAQDVVSKTGESYLEQSYYQSYTQPED